MKNFITKFYKDIIMCTNIVNQNNEFYWAYFSETQYENKKQSCLNNNKDFRVNYYEDFSGNEVLVTEVQKLDPENYHNNFSDVIKIGKVKKWKRSELR